MTTDWLARFRELSGSGDKRDRTDEMAIVDRHNAAATRNKEHIVNYAPFVPDGAEIERPEGLSNQTIEYDWYGLFEERAAVRQNDGRRTRAEAEQLAWGELENRWHMQHGERVARDMCAGCRRPLGNSAALNLIDGNRVHSTPGNACLIQHGERWRAAARQALIALGMAPPPQK